MSMLALNEPVVDESLVLPAPPVDSSTCERVWFALAQKSWTTLAVVPTDRSVRTERIVLSLVAAGEQHGARSIRLVDATGVTMRHYLRIATSFRLTGAANCMIVRLDPVADNPTTLGLARAASAVLVVARFGESRLSSMHGLVEAIGRERVAGCVVVP